MLKWFRRGPSPYQTPLAMIGAKPGDRVVFVTPGDEDLVAEVALVTGLNGQTAVVDRVDARTRVDAAATAKGALVDFLEGGATSLPVAAEAADIIVLVAPQPEHSEDAQASAFAEAMRVIRPGGRVMVIDGRLPKGVFGSRSPQPHWNSADAVASLERAGARAARQLAVADGVAYYEARKSR